MFDFILRPLRRNFGVDKHFYAAIDDMFGFVPNNIELYKVALIHKSASVELEDGSHINNERLEFLGDDPLEWGIANPSSVLAWRIPWTEEPGRLQSTGSQERHT